MSWAFITTFAERHEVVVSNLDIVDRIPMSPVEISPVNLLTCTAVIIVISNSI